MGHTQTYTVKGMDCAHCAETLEHGIAKLDGVSGVRVDFMANRIIIDGEASYDSLRQRAQTLGSYDLIDSTTPTEATMPLPTGLRGFAVYLLREQPTRFALAGGTVSLLALIVSLVLTLPPLAIDLLYIVGTAIAAYPIARSGINNLRINHTFNINMLMTIAAVGAIIIGETSEAAVVVFLYAIGEALEGFTADRARDSIRAIADLAPPTAHKLHGNHAHTVPIESLAVGDHVLVKPSERVPMDGVVISGQSAVNQAPITGESLPIDKGAGETVYAGSINGDGALTVEVTQLAQDNTLSRIIQLVEDAQNVRAPSQRRIDRFAAVYTPAMVVAALLVMSVPPLFFGQPFLESDGTTHGWLYRALAMLMVACPCALVISTPVAVVSAITNAARRGVLIKGGLHLESLGRVRAIAFDKTGTLTQGKPQVAEVATLDSRYPQDKVLAYAAAIESQSTHPLAQAIVQHAGDDIPAATDVTSITGRGLRGVVDGVTVTVGSHRLFDERIPHNSALCAQISAAEGTGRTVVMVAFNAAVVGYVTLADAPREESADIVQQLQRGGLKTIMLTGDNAATAQAISHAVGVDETYPELLPQDKTEAIGAMRALHGRVAMVGDGVNDTPALAAASVGVAMGGAGSAQAIETADIVLMQDDLRQLPFTFGLSRFTTGIITQNIVLSVAVKLGFAALAVMGMTSLWLAIVADVGMLVLVTLNGLRPLGHGR